MTLDIAFCSSLESGIDHFFCHPELVEGCLSIVPFEQPAPEPSVRLAGRLKER